MLIYSWFLSAALAQDVDADGWDVAVDCDDTDPDIYPGAPEACDGLGDPDTLQIACDPPAGVVFNDRDDDDTRPYGKGCGCTTESGTAPGWWRVMARR